MNRIFNILLSIQMFSIYSFAQVNQDWVKRYDGPANSTDIAKSVAVDASGNVYVTGISNLGGSNYDYATIKYNAAGVQQWVVRYFGLGDVEYQPLAAVDQAGNVYVAGAVWGNTQLENFALVKYNSSGSQQWVQTYNGTANQTDEIIAVAADAAGNVYVTGKSFGSGTLTDFVTIKYNSSGSQQWAVRYNRSGSTADEPQAISIDGSGNVYVTGASYDAPHNDCATVKYNSSGSQQWAATYVAIGNNTNVAYDIDVSPSGNVYITGRTGNFGTNADYVTIKYNSSGVQQWLQRYNGPVSSNDEAFSIEIDSLENVYITGISEGSGSASDFVTIKYNSSGVQQWLQRYNGPGNGIDNAYALTLDAQGNVYVTGNSKGTTLQGEYATIKYNSSGVQQWEQRYEGPGNFGPDNPYTIVVDNSGNVYVTGESYGSATFQDYATVKYSQPIGIQNISGEIPKNFSLLQNYPNPFNPATNIEFAISNAGFVKLVVFDMLGREIETLVNENLRAGTFKVNWDASKNSSGVYFYKLEANNFVEAKKMLMIK